MFVRHVPLELMLIVFYRFEGGVFRVGKTCDPPRVQLPSVPFCFPVHHQLGEHLSVTATFTNADTDAVHRPAVAQTGLFANKWTCVSGIGNGSVDDGFDANLFQARQAIENGLADKVGYEEDALDALASSLGLSDYEAVEYSSPATLLDILLSKAETPPTISEHLLEFSIPRAMYYCSWNPWVPVSGD